MPSPLNQTCLSSVSPFANSCRRSPFVSVNGPDQLFWPKFPAEFTHRIPALRASDTNESAMLVPSRGAPRSMNPAEKLMTLAPWLFSHSSACWRSATVSLQDRYSRASGAIVCTISATAVPCWFSCGSGLLPAKSPPQVSAVTTLLGTLPAALAWASPAKLSMIPTLTPLPVMPFACNADAPLATTSCPGKVPVRRWPNSTTLGWAATNATCGSRENAASDLAGTSASTNECQTV